MVHLNGGFDWELVMQINICWIYIYTVEYNPCLNQTLNNGGKNCVRDINTPRIAFYYYWGPLSNDYIRKWTPGIRELYFNFFLVSSTLIQTRRVNAALKIFPFATQQFISDIYYKWSYRILCNLMPLSLVIVCLVKKCLQSYRTTHF